MSDFDSTTGSSVIDMTNSVFGREVSYFPIGGGSPITLKGVFDNSWVDIDGVISLKPTLRIKLADLDTTVPDSGDLIAIGSTDYRVIESRPDGFGGTTLILQKD